MIRFAFAALDQWLLNINRKPAVIRGARQVGKTRLVRDLAERHGRPSAVEYHAGGGETNGKQVRLQPYRTRHPDSPHKKAFHLLCEARVCSKVVHTGGNGLPLGAESNEKFFKAMMPDVGLTSAQLGFGALRRSDAKQIILTNKGGVAEQFVGRQLRSAQAPLMDPGLFYWKRTGGRVGEIDYVVQHENRVVPVEVKSGTAGGMKSLHQFMADKNLHLAVRFDLNPPSMDRIHVKTTLGQPVAYTLLSLPVSLAGYLDAFIR